MRAADNPFRAACHHLLEHCRAVADNVGRLPDRAAARTLEKLVQNLLALAERRVAQIPLVLLQHVENQIDDLARLRV